MNASIEHTIGPLACLAWFATIAAAQTYPARPVRLVTPTAAGSGSDVVARIISGKLTEVLGTQIVVDNRAGVSGLLAAELVARARPTVTPWAWLHSRN